MSLYRINQRQIVCVASFLAKPGKEQALIEALGALIPDTRKEDGCIRYELNQSRDEPRRITFVEKFVDIDLSTSTVPKTLSSTISISRCLSW